MIIKLPIKKATAKLAENKRKAINSVIILIPIILSFVTTTLFFGIVNDVWFSFNIIEKIQYTYSTLPVEKLTDGNRFSYNYPASGWKDKLMQYNGECFEYDSLGNPTKYRDKHLEWKYGRQLAVFDSSTFNYNADGIRISKTYNGITTHFYLDGTKILAQDNGNILSFSYGVDGVIGFTYEGVGEYFYKKNIFGDIIGILNSSGDEIAKYTYDAWGNHKTLVLNNNEYVDILSKISYTTEGSNNKFIAELNPFRYRGYYYDIETGLYYLNSRYYDPEIGRFINADDVAILSESMNFINGLNLYMYCNNNPTMYRDISGEAWWDWLFVGFLALATITLAFLTAGAIIAAAPAIAGFAGTLVSSIGLASLAGTAATVVSIGAGVLAVTTIGLGINNAISTLSGFNPIASLIGQEAYNVVQSTIGILGYSYIMIGSMLPYPSTGNSSPQNLKQQLAMKEAKLNPNNHSSFTIYMKDPRMPGWLGWQKYTQLVKFNSGIQFDIHYVGNKYLNWIKFLATWFDFKIK